MYFLIYVGAYYFPIRLEPIKALGPMGTPVVIWTLILLIYCYIASVLPVWMLLQPRDFINSLQLGLALVFLVLGVAIAGLTGKADIASAAPAINSAIPADAPPLWPFLFITIACGACSGFHCLVSSGTSSKQLSCEPHAQFVGYGSMLLEGALAVLVIVACTAGVAMGKFDRQEDLQRPAGYTYVAHLEAETGAQLTGNDAWRARYPANGKWSGFTLAQKVGAFVEGGANLLTSVGVPLKMAIGIMAVLLACFAATTLDTATRLARYVVQELGSELKLPALSNRYLATFLVVFVSGGLAMYPGPNGPGSGGLILWPLFGATNQLLAGLAFLVIAFFLWRRGRPVWMVVIPGMFMLLIPGWGMLYAIFKIWAPWLDGGGNLVLFIMGLLIVLLQLWMLIEAIILWPSVKGRLEQVLPPLVSTRGPINEGGRAC
jgi:carbon starvation protein